MIAKGSGEMNIELDESRIEDMQYISEQFGQSKWCKPDSAVLFDWLNPFRLKLNPWIRFERVAEQAALFYDPNRIIWSDLTFVGTCGLSFMIFLKIITLIIGHI